MHSHPHRGIRPRSPAVVVGCLEQADEPARVLGLDPGNAHVLFTAGGRVSDDVLAHLAHLCGRCGVRQIVVTVHPGCRWSTPSSPRVVPGDPAPSHDQLRRDAATILEDPMIAPGVLVSGLWLTGANPGEFEVVVPAREVPTPADRRRCAA